MTRNPTGEAAPHTAQIRRAVEADAEIISDLTRRLIHADSSGALSDDAHRYLDKALSAEQVRQNMRGPYRYFVAERHGTPVGVAATRDDCHLLLLFVAKEAQGRGIARSLWSHARKACRAAGYSGPFTVSALPEAMPIYQRLGFTRQGPATIEHGISRTLMSTAS